MSYQEYSYQTSSFGSNGSASGNLVNQAANDLLLLASGSGAGQSGSSFSSGNVAYGSSSFGANAGGSSGSITISSSGAGAGSGAASGSAFGSAAGSGVAAGSGSGVSGGSITISSSGAGAGAGAGAGYGAAAGGSSGSISITSSGAGAGAGGAGSVFLSAIEQAILRSTVPIDINETEEITVLGQRGIWANRAEVVNWRGQIPIGDYQINEDSNPEIINKRVNTQLEYIQELAIRYLRPPNPPTPGEIVIVQEGNSNTAPAPPLVIRQQPARPDTPEPLVIREAPPEAPRSVGRKVITISGRRIPPPPRKVIIERLAQLPSKPQSVLIERWLPYSQVKRRVIFQNNGGPDIVSVRPRNVVVQWEAPQVNIRKEIKYLGVINANPADYVQRYGASLRLARDLPQFVLDIATPDGLVLAANHQASSVLELEGDLQALGLVDLDREGLSEYRAQLQRLGITFQGAGAGAGFGAGAGAGFGSSSVSVTGASGFGSASASGANSSFLVEFIPQLQVSNGFVNLGQAETLFITFSSNLGRNFAQNETRSFFQSLDRNGDGRVTIDELRQALERFLLNH